MMCSGMRQPQTKRNSEEMSKLYNRRAMPQIARSLSLMVLVWGFLTNKPAKMLRVCFLKAVPQILQQSCTTSLDTINFPMENKKCKIACLSTLLTLKAALTCEVPTREVCRLVFLKIHVLVPKMPKTAISQ